jgi:hypothetical protein
LIVFQNETVIGFCVNGDKKNSCKLVYEIKDPRNNQRYPRNSFKKCSSVQIHVWEIFQQIYS